MPSDWLPNVWLIDNGNYWQARWTDRRGEKRAKSLGAKSKVSKREATRLCRNIAVKLTTGEISGGGRAPTLETFIDQYIRLRPELSPMTVYQVRNTGSYLVAHFTADRRIDRITREDALEWLSALASGGLFAARKIELKLRATTKISAATVAKHARTAKTMFNFAVSELELISRNPFSRLSGRAPTPPKSWAEVSRADLQTVLAVCPNDGWRSLFALCRLAGVRRGEALRLKWIDLDFRQNAMTVNARLDKVTTKKSLRLCPIEPPKLPAGLAAELQRIKASASGELVCEGVTIDNIDRHARRILEASGVGSYAKPFHTLRKCFENELVMKYPMHIVEAWIGHSEEVAKRHYLRVDPELFNRRDWVQTGVQIADDLGAGI